MVKFVLLNLLTVTLLLAGLEGTAWLLLPEPERRPPFFDAAAGSSHKRLLDEGFPYPQLDPLLAWAPSRKVGIAARSLGSDYRVYGAEDPRALRLFVTGGSTSDSFSDYEHTWPKILVRSMRQRGYCVTGLFGAVSGYDTGQEMLKALRDRHSLRPDLHLSYSGVNEDPVGWPFLSHTFIITALKTLVEYQRNFFMPNSVRFLSQQLARPVALEGVNQGLPQAELASERWLSHVRAMRALSKEFGYEFISILQPMLGIGAYNPNAREQKIIAARRLKEASGKFYREARAIAAKTPYIEDLVDVFAGRNDIFTDECHVTTDGNQVVAAKILALLESKSSALLTKFRFPCQ